MTPTTRKSDLPKMPRLRSIRSRGAPTHSMPVRIRWCTRGWSSSASRTTRLLAARAPQMATRVAQCRV